MCVSGRLWWPPGLSERGRLDPSGHCFLGQQHLLDLCPWSLCSRHRAPCLDGRDHRRQLKPALLCLIGFGVCGDVNKIMCLSKQSVFLCLGVFKDQRDRISERISECQADVFFIANFSGEQPSQWQEVNSSSQILIIPTPTELS